MGSGRNYTTQVKAHSTKHLEIKSSFPLGKKRRVKKYTLDAWFYIPSSLGVNEKDYSVEQFFANLRTLTRFGSAHLPLSSIVDQTCDLSPSFGSAGS